MDLRVTRIIEQVKARGISLNPPLDESNIRAFEHRHGVELPPGYRTFLRYVGDGGSGPDGLELFRLGSYRATDVPKSEYIDLSDIRLPFPFSTEKVWEGQCESDEYYDDLSRLHYGNLCISSSGCAMHHHLIVTGPERGNVWAFAWDFGICPVEPVSEFMSWYENWLNNVTT